MVDRALDDVDPDRWQRVKRLFFAALELPAAEVDAFLDEQTTGDRDLRSSVESLLTHSRTASEFLDAGGQDARLKLYGIDDAASRPHAREAGAELVLGSIGGYRLVRV